ncbi:MAG: hypothetical protein J6I84_03480 [Bacilli bacterium]|nr:hypothetical protein [Bacilli bacterium]
MITVYVIGVFLVLAWYYMTPVPLSEGEALMIAIFWPFYLLALVISFVIAWLHG